MDRHERRVIDKQRKLKEFLVQVVHEAQKVQKELKRGEASLTENQIHLMAFECQQLLRILTKKPSTTCEIKLHYPEIERDIVKPTEWD